MRRSVWGVIFMGLLVGCSSQADKDNTEIADGARSATTTPVSPEAAEAQSVVRRYFDAIARRDFAAAYGLWGHDGADTGGSAAQFAASFDHYKSYKPSVGIPTEVKTSGRMQYVLVPVELNVELKDGGPSEDRKGPVMLRRSEDRSAKGSNLRDWRIWGTDIRVPH